MSAEPRGTHPCGTGPRGAEPRGAEPRTDRPSGLSNGGAGPGRAPGKRLRIGILFGGRSAEHEVSIVSAQGVMAALDTDRFQAVPIGVTRQGTWLTLAQTEQALRRILSERLRSLDEPLGEGLLYRTQVIGSFRRLDIVFPLIHGANGEDGTLQGFLELAGVPYVGAGVAASALGMDKALQKTVFRQGGIPVTDDIVVLNSEWRRDPAGVRQAAEAAIGYPCFVKPANSGSSIGTAKVRSREDLDEAIAEALRYDRKVLIEKAVAAREVEVAVLGNDEPEASPVGEITYRSEFYDYRAKYDDPHTELHIPAAIPQATAERLRETALAAYRAIDCAGLARVDFFLKPDGEFCLNEVNTIPGFTPMSMYPRLWEYAGLSYRDLITRLIELGLERHQEKRRV
ncbi:MAG: D-alanine--D-alanine ligase family protein [Dehalococcoidia bacterium]|nr:D-alanine--D-alanine ligase family protein [Dehalococcoidia bacterium]